MRRIHRVLVVVGAQALFLAAWFITGPAVALAECAMADRQRTFGADVDLSEWSALPLRALLFGEAQGRVVISTADAAAVLAIAERHGVPARRIGTVTEHDTGLSVRVGDRRILAPIGELAAAYHEAIPTIMNRPAQVSAVEPVSAGA